MCRNAAGKRKHQLRCCRFSCGIISDYVETLFIDLLCGVIKGEFRLESDFDLHFFEFIQNNSLLIIFIIIYL